MPERVRINWVFPLGVVLVAGSLIAFLHFSERVESYYAAYLIPGTGLLACILLLIWFNRSRGFPRRTRRVCTAVLLGGIVLVAVAVRLTTRVQGVMNGIGVPQLVWRWSPKPGENLPEITAHQRVDLSTTRPTDFPEFLGPGRRGVVEHVGLSHDWSRPPRLVWRQPIGLGWSSFAIVGDYAVTQEQRGDREMVVCYQVSSGKPQWAHVHEHTRFIDGQGGDGPRATPTIAGGRVYAMGATGILDCLDGATGDLIWTRKVIEDDQNLTYGKTCSPLALDRVVVVTGGREGPSLIAYDKDTGSPRWTARTDVTGYASPILTTLAGIPQIVTINESSVSAHDPADGHILWSYPWPGTMPKTIQPIPIGANRLLISAGYGIGTSLLGIESAEGKLAASPEWTSPRLKPKLTNSVVCGGLLIGVDDPGALTCLDLANGKRLWRDDSVGFGQLLGVDDLLLVEYESGELGLCDPKRDGLHELGRFTALKERTWAEPALSGHFLLLRNDREAVCFQLP